ncbi:MAG TPA: serine/threonine protein kinase [Thiotrichaceae bacterium]|jgi:serine/threonine protein kinase|nr:serine/threonine protein kinase [Thiotrichaceae bacterium]
MNGITHRNSLPSGFELHWYKIKSILGQGGFGITYLAQDLNLHIDVAIKEYLPIEFAVRENKSSVYPISENHSDKYTWGLERFISEAQTLAKFKHPNIVPVLAVFEENNTGYMVMNYEHGQTLQDKLKNNNFLPESELTALLFPILDGLDLVHKAGFIHRDLKPDNIFIHQDNTPVLLDFGSARQSLGEKIKTLTSMVSSGYAPYEQYYSKSNEQGPWTDIYGMGATLYRAATGISPIDAIERSKSILEISQDTYVTATEICEGRYSKQFLNAIDHAMQFKYTDRPQSITDWRKEFEGDILEIKLTPTERHTVAGTKHIEAKSKPKHSIRLMLIALLTCAVFLFFYSNDKPFISIAISSLQDIYKLEPAAPTQQEIITEYKLNEEKKVRQAQKNKISQLLNSAEKNIALDQIVRPDDKNALRDYQDILLLEPENKAAIEAKKNILKHYLNFAEEAIQKEFFDAAESYLEDANIVDPDSAQLRIIHAQLIEEQTRIERIQLKNEKRKLEEQRLAELKQKQQEQQLQQQLILEQERREAEKNRRFTLLKRQAEEKKHNEELHQQKLDQKLKQREKRRQESILKKSKFNHLLFQAQQALSDNKLDIAIIKFQESKIIFPDSTEAQEGLRKASVSKEICNAVIGTWHWFNGGLTTFLADGTLVGEHQYLPDNSGTWKCTDAKTRRFTLKWHEGDWTDELILSTDKIFLDGQNQEGKKISGKRLD